MICGNPQMVKATTAALEARGLERNRRRSPGHITVENYW
jgi:ferredoxin--NADP+ reductase